MDKPLYKAKAELTVDHHIKTNWHSIARMYNVIAAPYDITMATGYVLLNIDKNGTPATKIAPLLGLEPRSLTRMLKNLEEKGWIKRIIDDNDKRIVNVFLTDQGKFQRDSARKVVLEFNRRVKEAISEEKLSVFFEIMREIAKVVDVCTTDLSSE
jgi:MarR family transcriptional regulator, organic hydroperoxide resistance regulator